MTQFFLLRKWGYGLLAVAAVSIFSIAFSILAIYSVNELDNGLNTVINHPLKVSAALYNIRKAASDMETRLGRLYSHTSSEDIAFVRDNAAASLQSVEKDLAYITQNYLGPKEEAATVAESMRKLSALHEALLNGTTQHPIKETVDYIEKNMLPLFQTIDSTIGQKMLVFISGTGARFVKSSHATLKLSIFLSVLLSCSMIALVIVAQRIAYKRNTEKKHREDILKIISENSDNVFLLYNLQQNAMEYVSPNVGKVLGADVYTLQRTPRNLLHFCDEDHLAALVQIFDGPALHAPVSQECLFHNPRTNTERWTQVSIHPVTEHEKVTRYIFSIADLTEIKKNQNILREALLAAQEANEAKSQFFSHMSHDIRTPMNAIIGMTTIAATVMDDKPRLGDCLGKIATSSRHLLMLINDVLDISKIESGKFTLAHIPFGLGDLLNDVTAIIYPQARTKKQHFEISTCNIIHESLVGDPLRLNQVLLNILSNALKFTPEGGSIRMTIEQRPERRTGRVWITFTITDTGKGMNPEFLQRLFHPFEQEHGSNRMGVGTGLGMAITQNVLSLMNGTIHVESVPDQGSTFTVGLGFDVDSDNKSPVALECDNMKVMVVDDDRDTCEHTYIILKKMGIEAQWVLSGHEAVDCIVTAHQQGEGFDVIFMDWKMPEMDGLEATRRIRKHVGPDTLIIIISAYDWAEIEQEAHAAGANAFIAKPMFQSTIYNALRNLTRGLPAEKASAGSIPDFNGKHFLLVEDNEINSEIAVEFLRATGVSVDVVTNGALAVQQFEASPPGTYAAILMDVQMPVMDGYEATRSIRDLSHPDAEHIFILAMTADAFADDVAKALHAGMNDHISKPIDIELLFQKIVRGLHI